jgi:hypothetical protein
MPTRRNRRRARGRQKAAVANGKNGKSGNEEQLGFDLDIVVFTSDVEHPKHDLSARMPAAKAA